MTKPMNARVLVMPLQSAQSIENQATLKAHAATNEAQVTHNREHRAHTPKQSERNPSEAIKIKNRSNKSACVHK